MAFKPNAILLCDFYKVGHPFQYPKGTEYIYSNLTPRNSAYANKLDKVFDEKIVFFGLQGVITEFLLQEFEESFFERDKKEVLEEYKRRVDGALGEGSVSLDHIAALHDLGYLPVEIKALPEGSLVNIKVPVLTIRNTLPEFFWVTNFLETLLSAELWKMSTSATTAYQYRRLIEMHAEETGGSKDFVKWQGHDFSMRGMSGIHDAAISGAGHLLSFTGTDTIPAIDYLEQYYYGMDTFVGGSVPASEHSVICAGGDTNEVETIRLLIQDVYPSGVVSVVSDSWDYWNVITNTAKELKDVIMSRTPNALGQAKTVFRPDSGIPEDIICGTAQIIDMNSAVSLKSAKERVENLVSEKAQSETPHGECGLDSVEAFFSYGGALYKMSVYLTWDRHDKQFYYLDSSEVISCEIAELSPQEKGSVQCLWEIFGGTTNEKGYRTLDSHVGLIYGDSITLKRADEILRRLKDKGFASDNIVFGVGSYTYNLTTRDSYGFAMKATHAVINGESRDLFKDPKTDSGVKKSAKGLLRVEKEGDDFVLYDQQTEEQEKLGELKTVFKDGWRFNVTTLAKIRERVESSL